MLSPLSPPPRRQKLYLEYKKLNAKLKRTTLRGGWKMLSGKRLAARAALSERLPGCLVSVALILVC